MFPLLASHLGTNSSSSNVISIRLFHEGTNAEPNVTTNCQKKVVRAFLFILIRLIVLKSSQVILNLKTGNKFYRANLAFTCNDVDFNDVLYQLKCIILLRSGCQTPQK